MPEQFDNSCPIPNRLGGSVEDFTAKNIGYVQTPINVVKSQDQAVSTIFSSQPKSTNNFTPMRVGQSTLTGSLDDKVFGTHKLEENVHQESCCPKQTFNKDMFWTAFQLLYPGVDPQKCFNGNLGGKGGSLTEQKVFDISKAFNNGGSFLESCEENISDNSDNFENRDERSNSSPSNRSNKSNRNESMGSMGMSGEFCDRTPGSRPILGARTSLSQGTPNMESTADSGLGYRTGSLLGASGNHSVNQSPPRSYQGNIFDSNQNKAWISQQTSTPNPGKKAPPPFLPTWAAGGAKSLSENVLGDLANISVAERQQLLSVLVQQQQHQLAMMTADSIVQANQNSVINSQNVMGNLGQAKSGFDLNNQNNSFLQQHYLNNSSGYGSRSSTPAMDQEALNLAALNQLNSMGLTSSGIVDLLNSLRNPSYGTIGSGVPYVQQQESPQVEQSQQRSFTATNHLLQSASGGLNIGALLGSNHGVAGFELAEGASNSADVQAAIQAYRQLALCHQTGQVDPLGVEKMAKIYRGAAAICEPNCTWSGPLPARVYKNPIYSCKVFVGGVPWDITESTLLAAFKPLGPVHVEWPGKEARYLKAGIRPSAKGKGYVYVIFENEKSVKSLLANCSRDFSNNGDWYFRLTTRRVRTKEIRQVQIIPWVIGDSTFVKCNNQRMDPQKTVFVGALHGMVTAEVLATVMNDLFGGVVYAGIDTDKYKYPIGSGRVTFNNQKSYLKAVNAAFLEIKTAKFTKKVQIDPYLEDAMCCVCQTAPGPYFCREAMCFRYFCKTCWQGQHILEAMRYHKPLMRNTRSSQLSPGNDAQHVTRWSTSDNNDFSANQLSDDFMLNGSTTDFNSTPVCSLNYAMNDQFLAERLGKMVM